MPNPTDALLRVAYAAPFALMLVLINPWGQNRGQIWTDPKVAVLLVIVLFHLGYLLLARLGGAPPSGASRRGSLRATAGLWAAFLLASLITAALSPVPFTNAIRAHLEMGDGWRYALLLALFTLSNALLLARRPQLFRLQLYGVLVGGALLAASMVPQLFDWTVDYTDTSGQISSINPQRLESSMWKSQMPMGLDTSRGHASFVLAAIVALALVALLRGWIQRRYGWPLVVFCSALVVAASTRGTMLALAVGVLYLLFRTWSAVDWRRRLLVVVLPLLGVALFVGGQRAFDLSTRALPRLLPAAAEAGANRLDEVTSERNQLWRDALVGIRMRPLLGWGFNGFGLAWPYVTDWSLPDNAGYRYKGIDVEEVTIGSHYRFTYRGTDGELHDGWVRTNKAHNIVLDTLLSFGLLGTLPYLALFLLLSWLAFAGPGRGLEAVAVVYLAYTLTWFESAQYSHLVWWALGSALGLVLAPRYEVDAELGSSFRERRSAASEPLAPPSGEPLTTSRGG